MKIMLSLTAVAALALTSAPAVAQPHGKHHAAQARHARPSYAKGHRFNRNYHYTSYSALPRTYVTRYHLTPRYRYVYNNGYIYMINPTTYAVMQILNAF